MKKMLTTLSLLSIVFTFHSKANAENICASFIADALKLAQNQMIVMTNDGHGKIGRDQILDSPGTWVEYTDGTSESNVRPERIFLPDAQKSDLTDDQIIVDLGLGGDHAALQRVDYLASNSHAVAFRPYIAIRTENKEIRTLDQNRVYDRKTPINAVAHMPPGQEYLGSELQVVKIVGQQSRLAGGQYAVELSTGLLVSIPPSDIFMAYDSHEPKKLVEIMSHKATGGMKAEPGILLGERRVGNAGIKEYVVQFQDGRIQIIDSSAIRGTR